MSCAPRSVARVAGREYLSGMGMSKSLTEEKNTQNIRGRDGSAEGQALAAAQAARLAELRAAAKEGRDPTASDDVLSYLLRRAEETGARRILEIGAGFALTSIAFALALPQAGIAAIERDGARAAAARENIASFGLSGRVALLEGDAADVLPRLAGGYDLIFLDAAKVQYRRFLPECKRLLKAGGVLFSDDVRLFADGVPPKRRMLAAHIEEYVQALESDGELDTRVHALGMGLAESVKRR